MQAMGEQPTVKKGPRAGDGDTASARRDRLIYMADLLRELEDLANRDGCATLSGLLALSCAEAQRQADTE